jgi:hypothetical protein
MASITDIRLGLETNLKRIPGLRTSPIAPDLVNPPIAIVQPDSTPVKFDIAMNRGLDEFRFIITVLAHRADERTAQNKLDTYCAGSGDFSVKQAVEYDRTLGGVANDCRVTEISSYGSISVNEIQYTAAEFLVIVYAS